MLDKIKLKLIDDKYLDNNGYISNDYKFKLNFPEFNIKDSIIIGKPEEKFETKLFLPIGEVRKGEGGLRTKGYFKFSYKYVNNTWMIVDYYGNTLTKVPDEIDAKINEYIQLTENIAIKELPLITVITVVYNGEKYLEQTIQSVINQTYPNVEYIIIDGGSTDGTIDLIKKYEDYIDYWVSEKDKGIYDAMNKGIEISFGNWLYFLNCNDLFLENNILSKVFKYFDKKNKAVYGNVLLKNKSKVYDGKFNRLKLIFINNICHQALFFNHSIFFNDRYEINCKILADYLLNIKYFTLKNYKYMPLTIAIYEDVEGKSKELTDVEFSFLKEEELKNNMFEYFFYIIFKYLRRYLYKLKILK